MNKAFSNFTWENDPSVNTPLSAENLNRVNKAVNEIDNRVISHDTTKANQVDMLSAITNVTFDESTGKFTFIRHNGTMVVLDTKLEKLILNWRFDNTTQILYMVLEDGSEMPVDLSAFITNVEFTDSDTIRAVIGTDGKVGFDIIDGSITSNKLQPNYLADIQLESTKASQSATNAQESADNAEASAVRAEEAAQIAQSVSKVDIATTSKAGIVKPDGTTITVDTDGTIHSVGGGGDVTQEDLENYLPKTGGEVDGSLIAKSANAEYRTVAVVNSVRDISHQLAGNGNYAIYDSTNGKAILQALADGTNTFNGTASGTAEEISEFQCRTVRAIGASGWYRVAEYAATNANTLDGAAANSFDFTIKRIYSNNPSEVHFIRLLSTYNGKIFTSQDSSDTHLFTKIRYTYNVTEGKAYIEVYYNGTKNNNCSFELSNVSDYVSKWTLITPTLTEETVEGVSVRATYDIPANSTPITTANKPSGTYTGNGSATSRTINTGGIGNVCVICNSAGMAIVTVAGAILRRGNTIEYLGASETKINDGIIQIATTNAVVNASGTTCSYQVL